ncbi:MAG: hypothetical protein KC636_27090, partial [Myxococcales bacterium]|nr:hypothetical protein [Myxococcales bacterium]
MYTKLILSVAATLALTVPNVSHAGTSCKSTWVKANSKLKTFFVPVGKLVCKQLNTDDEAAAKKCMEDVEKFAAKAEEIKEEWNKGEDGSWKIGPRALPLNRPQTGKVSTERQFVGAPVLNSEYTLEIDRTGGKAKKNLIVEICFVDENGDDVQYKKVLLSEDGKRSFSKTFTGVEGTFPLIHLNNEKWGTNAHQYTIKG